MAQSIVRFSVGMLAILLLALLTCYVNEATAQESSQGEPKTEGKGKTKDALKLEPDEWRNYGFGVALTYTQHFAGQTPVKNAQVVNGVVRVTEENSGVPRVMLETHYFFKPPVSFFKLVEEKEWGIGPFVGVQPGSNNIIDAVALGLMIGFRRGESLKSDVTAHSSFNLGIGWTVDTKSQVLGDGIAANQPLPAGETQVRFKETSVHGLLIMSSFSF